MPKKVGEQTPKGLRCRNYLRKIIEDIFLRIIRNLIHLVRNSLIVKTRVIYNYKKGYNGNPLVTEGRRGHGRSDGGAAEEVERQGTWKEESRHAEEGGKSLLNEEN